MAARIVYSGVTNDFIAAAFDDADITSLTSTQITTLEENTGFRATIQGTNFLPPSTPDGDPTGTMTSLSIEDANGAPVLLITGIVWDLTQFIAAIRDEIDNDGQNNILVSLLSLQPVEVDASGATIGANFQFDGVSTPVTLLGSAFEDTLGGGDNNDLINPLDAPQFDGDVVIGSLGNDTIDLKDVGPDRYLDVSYEEIQGPITVNVNGPANTATVNKGTAGNDVILNSGNVLDWGLSFWGTGSNDTFNLTSGNGNWMSVMGMGGDDTFNLTIEGTVRVNYRGGYGDAPSIGIVADLSTGIVSQDGFGGQDTINILGGDGQFELRGTDFADNITGSFRDERFILRRGDDTLDAGGGYDTLRYDRSGVEQIDVDLMQNQVTGVWSGFVFTHQIFNVEEIRGSRAGNDTLSGDDGENRLRAYNGNDLLQGFGGNDELYGGYGDDTLDPGDNFDYDVVDPGAGNDSVLAGNMQNGFLEVLHNDLVNQSGQTITIDMTATPGPDGTVATIDKGPNGVTRVLNADTALTADGMSFLASDLDDTFNISVTDGAWVSVRGGRGNDTYNINSAPGDDDAIVRLSFRGSNDFEAPTQGLNINLATGVISNDGFGGQDMITGSFDTRIEIRGTDNADTMIGSSRDERFIGRGGDDTIDGADGFDVVRYDRSGISAGVRVDLGAGIATGTWDGTAFTHSLSNIEGVRGTRDFDDLLIGSTGGEYFESNNGNDAVFADGAAAAYYGSTIANQVFRLYQATLDRTPDVGGHFNWTQRIATGERTLEEVADGFVNSPQFKATFSDNLTNTEFVTLLYNNVLGRGPDAQGLARWVGELDGGATKAQVVLGFSQSPQFINDTNAAANRYANESLTTSWSDDVFRLYQATLDRLPDTQGQNRWTGELADGASTLEDVAAGFVNSPQFKATFSDNLTNTEFVTLLYNNVLGRGPDAQGLARWVGELDGGATKASVVLGFSQSPQFQAETAEAVKTWMRDQGVHDVIEMEAGSNIAAGGQYADLFIFEADESGDTTVLDFEAWDYLTLDGFGYASLADAKAQMTQVGADVVFNDQSLQVTLKNTQLSDIQTDTFLDTFVIV